MLRIAEENDLAPPYTVFVRQELIIPKHFSKPIQPQTSTVETAQPVSAPASTPSSGESAPPNVSAKGFVWPAKPEHDYRYVMDAEGLFGLIVFGAMGEGVYAMADGKVVYAGDGIAHYGKMVIIRHQSKHLTVYAHNDSLLVEEDQQVKRGDLIATLGQTGNVNKPQLYVEARYRGRKVNIKPLLQ